MDLMELKSLAEQQGAAFEEFKKTNDEILAKKANGEQVGELEQKLSTINTDMESIRVKMSEIEKRSGRPGFGGEAGNNEERKAEYKSAFNGFARDGDDSALIGIHRKAMNTGSDPDGGYLVIPEMDASIDRVVPTVSAFYNLASRITIGTNKWSKRVKTSGMSARRIAEGGAGGESTNPKYAKIEVEVFDMEVEPWVYNDTLEDADIDLEMDLTDEAGIAFAELMAAEFITGTGNGECRGILGYTEVANASYAWGNVGYIASGLSGGFTTSAPADKVIDLQHALKQQYRSGASWLMADSTLGRMRQFKDGSGNYYLWNPDPTAGPGGRFLGSPVVVDDNMPAIGAGSFSVGYGNWQRAYKIVERRGTRLIRDNITSKGTTKFNFTRRIGGGVYNFEAYKLMKFATS